MCHCQINSSVLLAVTQHHIPALLWETQISQNCFHSSEILFTSDESCAGCRQMTVIVCTCVLITFRTFYLYTGIKLCNDYVFKYIRSLTVLISNYVCKETVSWRVNAVLYFVCVCVYICLFFVLYNCSHNTLKIINMTAIVSSAYHIHFSNMTGLYLLPLSGIKVLLSWAPVKEIVPVTEPSGVPRSRYLCT